MARKQFEDDEDDLPDKDGDGDSDAEEFDDIEEFPVEEDLDQLDQNW